MFFIKTLQALLSVYKKRCGVFFGFLPVFAVPPASFVGVRRVGPVGCSCGWSARVCFVSVVGCLLCLSFLLLPLFLLCRPSCGVALALSPAWAGARLRVLSSCGFMPPASRPLSRWSVGLGGRLPRLCRRWWLRFGRLVTPVTLCVWAFGLAGPARAGSVRLLRPLKRPVLRLIPCWVRLSPCWSPCAALAVSLRPLKLRKLLGSRLRAGVQVVAGNGLPQSPLGSPCRFPYWAILPQHYVS